MSRTPSKSRKSVKTTKAPKTKRTAKKATGKGWHDDPVRHRLAKYGISTTLPDGRRLDVSKFLPARGIKGGRGSVSWNMEFPWYGSEVADYVVDQLWDRAPEEIENFREKDLDIISVKPSVILIKVHNPNIIDEVNELALRIQAEKEADIRWEIRRGERE